jgi:L,D-transpeptidase ErfK/SrfK
VINVPEMRMYYFPGLPDEVVTFPLGLGPYNWQTPRGWFKLARKEVNPVWRVPPRSSGRQNTPFHRATRPRQSLGKYRFVLSIRATGSTAQPSLGVGQYYSHGCIRMPGGYPLAVRSGAEGFPSGSSMHR